jgi:hypothetical protein
LPQAVEWARLNKQSIVCTDQRNELVNDPSQFIKILDAFQEPKVVISMWGDSPVPGLEHGIDQMEAHGPDRNVTPSPPNAKWQEVLEHKMLRALISMNDLATTPAVATKLWAAPIGVAGGQVQEGLLDNWKERTEMKKDILLFVNHGSHWWRRDEIDPGYANDRWSTFAIIANKSTIHAECGGDSRSPIHYFEILARASFVWSPPGAGWDCYRTWESIYLGAIPVIMRTGGALDGVYADLPVLMLDSYTQVTEELLQETLQSFSSRSFNWAKLTWPYWSSMWRQLSTSS